ncbi:MAG: hypothetical protein Q7U75_08590 [Desulfobacterales bacterium]|nr:hypothetical protein [Desulfobacterales bacterium]
MSQELRVEFKMAVAGRRPAPKPEANPATRTERRRLDRAARKARNLALAHYIDGLVRSGEVADLAAVARMCGVSRARVSNVVGLLGVVGAEQEMAIGQAEERPSQRR